MIYPIDMNDINTYIKEFLIAPADKTYNYYQYYERNGELVRIGLVVICSIELSFQIHEIFEKNKGVNKCGVKNLLKFKCRFLKKFQKWEPFELISS